MAEPISLIASGVTLIDASVKLGAFAKRLARLKDADKAVEDVKSNLVTGKLLIQHVRTELESSSRASSPASTFLLSITGSIETKFSEIDIILARVCTNRRGNMKVSKSKWFREQKSVQQILDQLEKEMGKLGAMASLLTAVPIVQAQVKIEPPTAQANTVVVSQTSSSVLNQHHGYQTLHRHHGPMNPKKTQSLLYFISVLLASFSGEHTHCNRKNCTSCRQRALVFCFQVILPAWLLARSITCSFLYDNRKGLEIRQLRFPRIRPVKDMLRICEHMYMNDQKAMLQDFDTGHASPWDIDHFGNNLLAYAILLNDRREIPFQLLIDQGVEPLADFTHVAELDNELEDEIDDELCRFDQISTPTRLEMEFNMKGAKCSNLSTFMTVFENPEDMLNKRGLLGQTVLAHFITQSHFEETKVAIEYGADVSIYDDYGFNGLHRAALFAPRDIIHALANSPPSCNIETLSRPNVTFQQVQALRTRLKTPLKVSWRKKKIVPIDDGWWSEWEKLIARTNKEEEDGNFNGILESYVERNTLWP